MKKYLGVILFAFIFLLGGCAKPPEVPVITGVEEGRVYPSAVSISVATQDCVEYTATIDGEPHDLGSPFEENGLHTIIITATNTRNKLTNKTAVQFEIDTVPPVTPVVDGVKAGDVYFQSVQIGIRPEAGVTYDATIDGSPYQIGSTYTEVGEHVLRVTAHKTKNGLSSHREVRFAVENQTYTREEVDFFLEIALGTEYGGTAPICKWTEEIRIKINGSPTLEDLATLDKVITQLHELTKLNIVITDEEENMDIYFNPASRFIDYIPSYVEGNWGYFSYNANGDGEIWQAKIGIDIISTNQLSRNHLLQEELTQALGMGNDSFQYEDSIFYQSWSLVQDYSDMDKKVIELLYRDDILLGMDKEDILQILAPRIIE